MRASQIWPARYKAGRPVLKQAARFKTGQVRNRAVTYICYCSISNHWPVLKTVGPIVSGPAQFKAGRPALKLTNAHVGSSLACQLACETSVGSWRLTQHLICYARVYNVYR